MGVKRFVWDEVSDNVLLETDETDTVTARYCQRPERFGELLFQDRSGTKSFYHYDGNASTCNLTDSSESVTDTTLYTAYGEEVSSSVSTTNPFGYKGAVGYYTNESTSDIYVRNRSYEPLTGRWLSKDPLGFIDGTNLCRAYFVPNDVDPKGTQRRIHYKHTKPSRYGPCGCWFAFTEFDAKVDDPSERRNFTGLIVQQIRRRWQVFNCDDGSVKSQGEVEYFEAWEVLRGVASARFHDGSTGVAEDVWGTCNLGGPNTYGTAELVGEFGFLLGEDLDGWLWPGHPENARDLPGLPFPPPPSVLPDDWITTQKLRRDLQIEWNCCACFPHINDGNGVGWAPIEGDLIVP